MLYWVNSSSGGPSTFGHGLSKAPNVVITRNVNDSGGTYMYHTSLSDPYAKVLYPNDNNPEVSSVFLSATSSTLLTAPDGGLTDAPNRVLGYAWHDVEGFSRFSHYEGNGNANGPFVYLGFRPAWLVLKDIDTAGGGDWYIYDYKREGYNLDNDSLRTNYSSAESADDNIELLSNGFKLRTTNTEHNSAGKTYIYLAFAETPFKYANAR
jgi:hypothetical protein